MLIIASAVLTKGVWKVDLHFFVLKCTYSPPVCTLRPVADIHSEFKYKTLRLTLNSCSVDSKKKKAQLSEIQGLLVSSYHPSISHFADTLMQDQL